MQEADLIEAVQTITFSTFELRGVVARRRVAFFGESYQGAAALPVPAFLHPLREAIGEWVGIEPSAFAMVLINEYRPGAPIGWHRDAPQYDVVVGISLGSACVMRFRPYQRPGAIPTGERRRTTHEVRLEPRSAYILRSDARQNYEHHIPAVANLRYSITFRTRRS